MSVNSSIRNELKRKEIWIMSGEYEKLVPAPLNSIETEIDLINHILEQAVRHGADIGGSYESNENGLLDAIYKYLIYRGLYDRYKVVYTDNDQDYCKLRIVRKIGGINE